MLLRPEYGGSLKDPVVYPYHGLLVKLRALAQLRLLSKVVQLKHIGAALRSSGHNFRGVDFRKALAVEIIPKAPDNPFLNLEFGPFSHIPQGYGADRQFGFQGGVHLPLVDWKGHGACRS